MVGRKMPGFTYLDRDQILQEIKTNNLRTSLILSGAYIQDVLYGAIKYNLIPLSGSNEKALFEGNGALSTFSAQISIAFAIGILSSEIRDDMNAIRGLRNIVAHQLVADLPESESTIQKIRGLNAISGHEDKQIAAVTDLVSRASDLITMYLILRTTPPALGASKELEEMLGGLKFSRNRPPLLREVGSADAPVRWGKRGG